MMHTKRLLHLEWDAIAGVIAAVTAIVMELLHLIQGEVLLTLTVALIALLFLRDMRREGAMERLESRLAAAQVSLREIEVGLLPPDAVLIGPNRIRKASTEFMAHASGEMTWFNVCVSMFKPPALFDALLRPALENPRITIIRFILDEDQRRLWEEILPTIRACSGAHKVQEPTWISNQESISLIVADSAATGRTECLLSFWGEPFMAHSTERNVPRYIFHIQGHSELISRFLEILRNYRLSA